MACFLAYMKQEWEVIRVRNYFADTEALASTIPRIHCNVAIYVQGKRCIVEVQLHFRVVQLHAKLNHTYYEIARATHPDEVVGKLEWPTDDSVDHLIRASEAALRPRKGRFTALVKSMIRISRSLKGKIARRGKTIVQRKRGTNTTRRHPGRAFPTGFFKHRATT